MTVGDIGLNGTRKSTFFRVPFVSGERCLLYVEKIFGYK